MRRVKVRVQKGRVISPTDLPEDFEGELTLPDEMAGHDLLGETNRAYAALRADPAAWKEERRERALWEGTLATALSLRARIRNSSGSTVCTNHNAGKSG